MTRPGNFWPVLAKLLATIVALIPLIAAVGVMIEAVTYQEPDPGAGNMGSYFPAPLFAIIGGIVLTMWAAPQLFFVNFVWRGRPWAFVTLAVLCLVQGAIALFPVLAAPRVEGVHIPYLAYVTLSILAGIALLIGRQHLPNIQRYGHAFPVAAVAEDK